MLVNMQRNRMSHLLLVGAQNSAPCCKVIWSFLKKKKLDTPNVQLAVVLLSVVPEKWKHMSSQTLVHAYLGQFCL